MKKPRKTRETEAYLNIRRDDFTPHALSLGIWDELCRVGRKVSWDEVEVLATRPGEILSDKYGKN